MSESDPPKQPEPDPSQYIGRPDPHPLPKPGTELGPFGWRKNTGGTNYTPTERQLQLEEIGKRMACCHNHSRIARDLNIPRPLVILRVRQIEKIWKEAVVATRESMLAKEKAILEQIRCEALDAWDRSKLDAEIRSSSRTSMVENGNGNGEQSTPAEAKASLTTRGQYGDPALLHVAIEVTEKMAKLFGLNEPDLIGVSWIDTVDQALTEARRRVSEERAALGPPN